MKSNAFCSLRAITLCYLLTVLPITKAEAVNKHWTGLGGDSDWSTADNWNSGEPTNEDDAFIGSNTGTHPAAASITQASEACNVLYVGYDAGTTGTVTMSGGDLACAGSGSVDGRTGSLILGRVGSSFGTLLYSGGDLWLTEGLMIGGNGTGSFIQDGGTITVSNGTFYCGASSTGSGTYTLMGGGTLNVSNNFQMPFGYNNSAGAATVIQYPLTTLEIGGGLTAGGAGGTSLYAMTNALLKVHGDLNIGNHGDNTSDFKVTDGMVTVGGTANIGNSGWAQYIQDGGTGTFGLVQIGVNVAGEGTFQLKNGGVLYYTDMRPGRGYNAAHTCTGTFIQEEGTEASGTSISLAGYAKTTGYYVMSGGVASVSSYLIAGSAGTGIFRQYGGTNTIGTTLTIGSAATSTGIYELVAGSLTVTGELRVASSTGRGTLDIGGGGTLNCRSTFTIADRGSGGSPGARGDCILRGGTINVDGVCYIRRREFDNGRLQGWGSFNATSSLYMNGVTVADGSGQDRTLVITNYSAFYNNLANGAAGTNGWYARDHGRLQLAPLGVTGDGTQYWGEQSTTDFDLVNAVKLDLTGVSGNGDLAGSLYAPDHGEVPTYTNGSKIAAIWRFETNGFSFSSATVSFRYDALRVTNTLDMAESELKAFRHNGSAWVRIPDIGIDTVTKTLTASNVATIAWLALAESMANGAPVVNAGGNQSIQLPADTVTLEGSASDDGLPDATLTTTWSQISGSGSVTFSNSNALNSTATFPTFDTYVLRLTATDGEIVRWDEMEVVVQPASGNQYPQVDAGPNQTMNLRSRTATLDGTVTDDGLPYGWVTSTWSKVSGAGPVSFGDVYAVDTTATFFIDDTYVLRLTADDGELIASDEVTITVEPATPIAHYWDAEGIDPDWATVTNWNVDTEPLYVDTAVIGHGSYTVHATAEVSRAEAVCNILRIGDTAGSSGALRIEDERLDVTGSGYGMFVGNNGQGSVIQNGGVLTCTNGTISLGYSSSGRGTYTLNAGMLRANSVQVGRYGLSSFVQQPGSICEPGALAVSVYAGAASSIYTMSGGVMNASALTVKSSGAFLQHAGTSTATSVTIGGDNVSNTSRVELAGGELTVGGVAWIGDGSGNTGALVVHDGARVTVAGAFRLGRNAGAASVLLHGGTVEGQSSFLLRESANGTATLQGWGELAALGEFQCNGRVSADGFGTDRTLWLSNYSTVRYSLTDTPPSTTGWYAQNQGRLLLKGIPVSGGGVKNWGGTTSTDLVNTVTWDFAGVTGSGTLTGSLYAADHSEVPRLGSGSKPVGIWNFAAGGFSFGNASLTVRYDTSGAAALGLDESALRLYQYLDGDSKWIALETNPPDTANKLVTATGVTSTGFFALGEINTAVGSIFLIR